ncbi:replication/maintenance protein RepL [Streptomyces sp. NPDC002812]|uniref:replication/maintenance protein RepL n=1 Tax=Streptomyces sp. NPDC002812 TaxID=3154434 RepID=UPI00333261CD
MGDAVRRVPKSPPAPPPKTRTLRPAGEPDKRDLAREIAERFGGLPDSAHEIEVTARVTRKRRRANHDMLGQEGYSLVSNYFNRRVLPWCLMHNVISKLQTAVLSNLIGRQQRGLITATQEEIAKEIGVSRQSVGPAIEALCHLNLVRQVKRKVYELNPRIAFNGNGDEQNEFLERLRTMKLENRFPDELAPELTLFSMADEV